MSAYRAVPLSERKYWNRTLAERELATWRASGLSLAEYGRQRGLDERRLSRWKRRLEESAGVGRQMAAGTPEFLPVRVVGVARTFTPAFEVELGDPVRVRVPSEFDAAALRRLLGVLEGC